MIGRALNRLKCHGVFVQMASLLHFVGVRLIRVLLLFNPPIFTRLWNRVISINSNSLPVLPKEFLSLPSSQHGLHKLISDFEFDSVLDIGSGSGEHALVLKQHRKKVTAIDFGTSVYAQQSQNNYADIRKLNIDFYTYEAEEKFDCIWASHVLEHQPDPGSFLRKCISLTKKNGIICITVPPLKNKIVGGHLTIWNAGLLLYQLVFNGLDCRYASILTYGYNITIIVKNKRRDKCDLDFDSGDIRKLKTFFPPFVDEPFEGVIDRWNW